MKKPSIISVISIKFLYHIFKHFNLPLLCQLNDRSKFNAKTLYKFLNLLISSWYTVELNDTSDIEKISYCQVYNIFPEYEEYLKDKIEYTEIKLKNIIEYKKLL